MGECGFSGFYGGFGWKLRKNKGKLGNFGKNQKCGWCWVGTGVGGLVWVAGLVWLVGVVSWVCISRIGKRE